MEYKNFDNSYLIRLDIGDEIISSLTKICKIEDIELAQVSAIGAVNSATIGLYDVEERQYHSTKIEKALEIASLGGNITRKEGAVYIHIHAVFSDIECKTYGGHLNEAVVSATCEIILNCFEGKTNRRICKESGLNVIEFG